MIAIRASSLSELFDCPARWEARHILGMRMPRSGAAQLGTALHASSAVFDQSRLPGGSPATVDEAAGALVDAIYRPEDDVDWSDSDATQREAEQIGRALHARYCTTVAPRQEYVGVEVRCERIDLPDLGIALTGTTDRVRRTPAGLGIADLKTGKTAVGTDGQAVTRGHGIQLGVYELLAQHALGLDITAPALVIGLQTGKTAAAQRVGTGEVPGARSALVGAEGAPGLLEHAAALLKAGAFYGNPRSNLCSAKYCPAYAGCRFRS
ncbi:MAG TPA: nuclease [Gammaproteobacteria bacterium]|nr:nuclease [Gammaproteobacteria bacterium]